MNKRKGFSVFFPALLTSIKTAVILIVFLLILSIAGSLIPQGREISFYTMNYGESWGNLITSLHFNNLFRSWIFLFAAALFFINLASCSFLRIYRRIKRGAPLRPGPDIIHLSLLLIMILGVMVLVSRRENSVLLSVNESFILPDGAEIRLTSFEIEYYEDGRPKDWTSKLELTSAQKTKEFAVEVNKPLKYGAYRVFQSFYDLKPHALIDSNRGERELNRREGIRAGTGSVYLMDIKDMDGETSGVFFLVDDSDSDEYEEIVLNIGDVFRDLTITDLYVSEYSGLQVVYQPGTGLIMIVLLVFCGGLALTFFQKLREGLS